MKNDPVENARRTPQSHTWERALLLALPATISHPFLTGPNMTGPLGLGFNVGELPKHTPRIWPPTATPLLLTQGQFNSRTEAGSEYTLENTKKGHGKFNCLLRSYGEASPLLTERLLPSLHFPGFKWFFQELWLLPGPSPLFSSWSPSLQALPLPTPQAGVSTCGPSHPPQGRSSGGKDRICGINKARTRALPRHSPRLPGRPSHWSGVTFSTSRTGNYGLWAF